MKKFNVTGVCIPNKHYMVDISEKLKDIADLINNKDYFTINKARQYGKTTTLNMLKSYLGDNYLTIKISFEGLGEEIFRDEALLCKTFVNLIYAKLIKAGNVNLANMWIDKIEDLNRLDLLSIRISQFVKASEKDVVLLIDEVDNSGNNSLFISFLGMLRNLYIERDEDQVETFHSVVLAGVHDVKNLKFKIRNDDEIKYNSPWNIAANFDIDMNFNIDEISSMLKSYENDKGLQLPIDEISELIFSYTNGYPFLVSLVCKIIDEKLNKNWTKEGIEEAIKYSLKESNTLFDTLIKNIENNIDFKKFMLDSVIN